MALRSDPARAEGMAGLDPQLIRLAAVVVLGAIMSILDTTIVNVALETLGRSLHAPLSSIQWVSTGYLLALSMVIPLSGWAVERFGAKRMWIISLVLFMAGSALSGAAWSASSLIAFRVLQGLGGGMIMPIGQTILAEAAGPERMGRVMSVLGVPMLLGPVIGPVLGGLIVDSASWRWIFYVNIPIGIVALLLALRILPTHEPSGARHPLDATGLALLSPGLAVLVYGLSEAGSGGSATTVGVTFGAGAFLMAAFVRHALRTKRTPLIEVRLFADRIFLAASVTTLLFGAALYGAMLLLPLYYQIARGESALSAGLLMAPQGIGAALVMPTAGRLTDRYGAGRVVPGGLVLAILGTILYTQLGPHTGYGLLASSLLVRGFGFGFVMMPTMAAAYQTLRRDQVPRASTTLNIVQRVGGSIGTALLAVVLSRQLATHVSVAAGATSGGQALSTSLRVRLAGPLSVAFGHAFWWAIALTVVSLVPGVMLPRFAKGRRLHTEAMTVGET